MKAPANVQHGMPRQPLDRLLGMAYHEQPV